MSVRVEEGGAATFTVVAFGEGLTYQWIGPDGQPLVDSAGRIVGSRSATLQVLNVQSGDVGGYRVVVSNGAGEARSDAALLSTGELEW